MKDIVTASRSLVLPAMQQHPNYMRALRAMGAGGHVLCEEGGTSAQVITRRIGPLRLNWVARGPLFQGEGDRAKHLAAMLGDLPGCTFALPDRAEETPVFRKAGFCALGTAQEVAELDLTPAEAARLAAQHGKWRNRLRHAQAGPVVITHSPYEPRRDAPLLTLEVAQRRSRRYLALPTDFCHAWAATNPKATRLFRADGPEGFLAFVLILLHAPTASYHIGWTGAAGRKTSAHNLLLWQASNWLASRGYLRLDLGGIDRIKAPGLARFKLGSGATAHAIGPLMGRLPGPLRRICPAR